MKTMTSLFVLTLIASPATLLGQNEPPRTQAQPQAFELAGNQTPPLISSMTTERFHTIVQAMGFECTRGSDGKPEPFFSFRMEGYKVIGYVESPDAALLYASFNDIKLPVEFFNAWNRNNRYSRAYREENGNASIEADIIVAQGVTKENIEAQIKTFRDSVVRFTRLGLDQQAAKAK